MWAQWDARRRRSAADSGVRAAAVAADAAAGADAAGDADGAVGAADCDADAAGSHRPTTVDRCVRLQLPWCSCWTWST